MPEADVSAQELDADESVEWIFGVILSLSATAVGSLGRILLRLTHLVKSKNITKWGDNSLCIFCFGVFCLIVNPGMDVLSYFFASPTLLAPLAGLTLFWNVIFAPMLLSERLSVFTVGGSFSALVGCVLVGMYGPKHDRHFNNVEEVYFLFTDHVFMIYMSFYATFVLFLLSIIHWKLFGDFWIKLSYGITSGTVGGFFIFLKCSIELAKMDAWDHWFTWFILFVTCSLPLFGLFLLNNSLRTYDALFILPLFHASLVLTGSTSSIILFHDLQELTFCRIRWYIVAISFIVFGVLLVSFHTDVKNDEEEESLLQDELSISLDNDAVQKDLSYNNNESSTWFGEIQIMYGSISKAGIESRGHSPMNFKIGA